MSTSAAYVYWIHLPEHSNINNEGYIGVTKNPNRRFSQHKNASNSTRSEALKNAIKKYKDKVLYTILLKADEEYCYQIENILRPKDHIGWNLSEGGHHGGGRLKGSIISEETKEKMRGKRPHVCQTAEKNNNARPIYTPYGNFSCLREASKHLNIDYDVLWYKLNKQKNRDSWGYLNRKGV